MTAPHRTRRRLRAAINRALTEHKLPLPDGATISLAIPRPPLPGATIHVRGLRPEWAWATNAPTPYLHNHPYEPTRALSALLADLEGIAAPYSTDTHPVTVRIWGQTELETKRHA